MIVEEPEDRVRVEERYSRRDVTRRIWYVLVWYPFEQWNTTHSTHDTEADAMCEAEHVRSHFNHFKKGDADGGHEPRP